MAVQSGDSQAEVLAAQPGLQLNQQANTLVVHIGQAVEIEDDPARTQALHLGQGFIHGFLSQPAHLSLDVHYCNALIREAHIERNLRVHRRSPHPIPALLRRRSHFSNSIMRYPPNPTATILAQALPLIGALESAAFMNGA